MALTGSPVPFGSAVVDATRRLLTSDWVNWFISATARLDQTAQRAASVAQTAQAASIPLTPIAAGVGGAGLYRVSAYQRVTTVAGVSSDLTFTLFWTDGGVLCSQAGALMNGNLTTTEQNTTFVVHCDSALSISYSVAYNSNPAGAMQFAVYVAVENVT